MSWGGHPALVWVGLVPSVWLVHLDARLAHDAVGRLQWVVAVERKGGRGVEVCHG